VSELIATSDVRAVASHVWRQQVLDVVRGATFVGALLLAWLSLHPFADLGHLQLSDIAEGSETTTYAAFGGLAALAVTLAMRDNWQGLKSLLTPVFALFGAWICVTVVLSFDPSTSIKRFALTIAVTATAAAIMLLPKSQEELVRWLAIAALVVLAFCFLGVLLAPYLSIHQATDAQEPSLAGAWRGAFVHKNKAASVVATLLFLGIYIARSGAWLTGIAIVGLSSLFMVGSEGKSAISLSIFVLLLTAMTSLIRSFWLRAVLLLTPLLLFNLLSVGTVMVEGLADIAKLLPLDTTFTGRSDIWTFAVQALQQRLPTGYGFSAFWGSSAIQDLPEGKEWAAFASHSHNGYLDTALGMGLPGLALLILALVIEPLRNFHKADRGGNNGPLTMALLRIWLFGLYLSSMESFFLSRAEPLWFTFLLAVFGLHYLSRFRVGV
jgi:O-antigen ligase